MLPESERWNQLPGASDDEEVVGCSTDRTGTGISEHVAPVHRDGSSLRIARANGGRGRQGRNRPGRPR